MRNLTSSTSQLPATGIPAEALSNSLARGLLLSSGAALASLLIPGLVAAADLTTRVLTNETPQIPSQCYTKTKDDHGRVVNPCYTCHRRPVRPNYTDDSDLQLVYDFPAPAEENPWKNLYTDRRAAIERISDAEILAYIRESNYVDSSGGIIPVKSLAELPEGRDYNGDGRWDGFVPDAWFDFDDQGFDRTPDGGYSGWRAFAYTPFPSTHWPTNGSTADALIRLPDIFQRDLNGDFNLSVYKTNLAIVEAMIREADVPIEPVEERALGGVDLNKNGLLDTASLVKYDWSPRDGRLMWYVGQALQAQRSGEVHLAARLYPEGTEFLQSLRYIDFDERAVNHLSARMKELRYARKAYWMTYAALDLQAAEETKEKHDFPDRVETVRGNMESGVSNGAGWVYAGMIEDAGGQLRPQTYEELAHCVGCHGGMGANTDASLAFPRKLDVESFQRGWYHWSQKSLAGLPEPVLDKGEPEYAFYLKANRAGDEFRANQEILALFFDDQGEPIPEMLDVLNRDIGFLLFASKPRALALNKAYKRIVERQSFHLGRDATVAPVGAQVHPWVADGTPTGVDEPLP
ncbi:hypothetical protein [Thiorhodovibrio frisius]|uniref:Uncharacterized protein n=1 Tax=Thiorhodovibrio frisius TaxID=631362 RepID=H8YWZ6_9GAMM|nr:hypothetical protein [Thiorhodovibrio frisius]EIC22972.1 hypothetical protein Thi970DRAFT_00620 [Thiorhodovibrio frisius]WPL22762.1 hypothetical protein Thiofri_02932 [Thiorhodovibrio frisius]